MLNRTLVEERHNRELPPKFAALSGQRVLVTGAAGFIGGALFKRLVEYGIDAVGTVLNSSEVDELRRHGYSAEVLDLASDERWEPLLKNVDTVFNIAALFQEAEQSEAMYHKVNVDGTVKLVQTAAKCAVGRFVHCSTVGVHGDVKTIPCTEDSPFNPMDEYHRTKLAGELAVLDFARGLPEDGMTVTVNRPAMVYGPGDTRMLKLFKTIASGKFFMIGSGKVLAHLGHIDDQVDSLLLSATCDKEDVHLEAFNIASGDYITLNELAATIAHAANVQLPRFNIPVAPVWFAGLVCEVLCRPIRVKPPIFRRRVGFFTHNRAFDLSKAAAKLGYVSNVGHVEGIKDTLNWYREHGYI